MTTVETPRELLWTDPLVSAADSFPRRVLQCGSVDSCQQTYVELSGGQGQFYPEGLPEDVLGGMVATYGEAIIARGRCRLHGPNVTYNAIPPRDYK